MKIKNYIFILVLLISIGKLFSQGIGTSYCVGVNQSSYKFSNGRRIQPELFIYDDKYLLFLTTQLYASRPVEVLSCGKVEYSGDIIILIDSVSSYVSLLKRSSNDIQFILSFTFLKGQTNYCFANLYQSELERVSKSKDLRNQHNFSSKARYSIKAGKYQCRFNNFGDIVELNLLLDPDGSYELLCESVILCKGFWKHTGNNLCLVDIDLNYEFKLPIIGRHKIAQTIFPYFDSEIAFKKYRRNIFRKEIKYREPFDHVEVFSSLDSTQSKSDCTDRHKKGVIFDSRKHIK